MQGTVRSVTMVGGNDAIEGDQGYLVAIRWDDGTLSEDLWDTETPPAVDERVDRD